MKNIKLFLTDVDGCMTDGGMYYTEKGKSVKKCQHHFFSCPEVFLGTWTSHEAVCICPLSPYSDEARLKAEDHGAHLREVRVHATVPTTVTLYFGAGVEVLNVVALTGRTDESTSAATKTAFRKGCPFVAAPEL